MLTVNSGSSANLIAFSTLTSPKLKERAIQKGDEVISVAAGFPTTVNPIVQFGAIPVFITVIVDRGGTCEAMAAQAKIIYQPMLTALDLGYEYGS